MKLQPRKIIFIGSILLVGALIQALPLKAHERRFHVPKKTNEPKTEKVIPETKINSNSSYYIVENNCFCIYYVFKFQIFNSLY